MREPIYRNQPLSEDQIASNRSKSKTRSKVEHMFGSWVMTMGGKLVRCIGIERVRAQLGLKNLTYNRSADAHGGSLKRYVFWQKRSQA